MYEFHISVPLVLEYEDAAKRLVGEVPLTEGDIDGVLDYLCAVGQPHQVFYLWRPVLRDPKDEMVLELAVAAACDYIITYNTKDFEGVEDFGVQAITPADFLERIGEQG